MISSCVVCLKLVCLHNAVHFGQEAPHKSNLYMVFLQGFDTTIDKCFCHGSWVPGPVLTVSCLYACAYVWAGVCGCVWLRLIRSSWESSPLGYISSCHALPLVRSLQFAVDVYEAFLVPGFRDSWALLLSWTPIAGDSSAHCFPALPASAPTESSVSAYGKLRFRLRKAPPLPYGSSASAYGKLRLVSRCVLLLVINSLFPQLNPPVFIVTVS